MAVEARHHSNLLPQQIITNREVILSFDQANAYGYNADRMSYVVPFGTTMADANNTFLPLNQSLVCDSLQAKTSMKAESELTCNLPNNISPRKRTRDTINNHFNSVLVPQKHNYTQDFSSSVVEESLSLQIQQQQLELDHLISQHSKKIRVEVVERQKQQARLLVSALGGSLMKTLKEKDEQVQKMTRLNLALEERAKSLYLESQLWKELAQSHEATAISLRCNLDYMLQAQVSDEQRVPEEAESCCGSNSGGGWEEEVEVVGRRLTLAGGTQGNRMCRKCGEMESCVLLLPCRHLCLCTMCGTTLPSACPVCSSSTNATVHVSIS